MSKRQIGKCEAIYRAIPALNLQGSNISCTFVASGYPENQAKFLKKVKDAEELEILPSQASSTGTSEYSSDEDAVKTDTVEKKSGAEETKNQEPKTQERDKSITQKSRYLSN